MAAKPCPTGGSVVSLGGSTPALHKSVVQHSMAQEVTSTFRNARSACLSRSQAFALSKRRRKRTDKYLTLQMLIYWVISNPDFSKPNCNLYMRFRTPWKTSNKLWQKHVKQILQFANIMKHFKNGIVMAPGNSKHSDSKVSKQAALFSISFNISSKRQNTRYQDPNFRDKVVMHV